MFGSLYAQENKNQTLKELVQYSDSSAQVLKQLYEASLKSSDTLEAIIALEKLALVYSHEGNHKKSYDYLWQALLLADDSKMYDLKALIYRDIGRHYSYFKRKNKSLKFLNLSLSLRKDLVKNGKIKDEELINGYLAFVATYRELNDFESAKKYLDSAANFMVASTSPRNKAFYDFEHGVILNTQGKYKEALKKFDNSLVLFSQQVPAYRVLIDTYIGDSYRNLKEYGKCEYYYLKALELSEKLHVHKDFTPLIYERLSDLYLTIGNKDKAFSSLKIAKKLDALYFDSRSKTNLPLLEIQDEFLAEKERQVIALKEQRIYQLEQEEKVVLLERILLFGFILFLILFGVLLIYNIRSKHKAEKRILRKKREFEIKKNKEVIELKNKELATSVIKLIEKDAFIDQLKEKLSTGKGDIDRQEAKQIINSISVNNLENWNEFETRFVSINKKFYTKLTKKFPDLTSNDQRLCALVKLNFSSKEIAKLLNMSNESVHTTRSRLRKKLNLSREVNLKQFIAGI
jgi:tetratricopeptide (TPR) repeat protein/DNA-binding CsgD family transcriptional regulator